MHYTKSGALDMRYSSSRAAVASSSDSYASSYSGSSRSKSSSSSGLHYKKDGTLDMRYSSSKAAVASAAASSPFSSSSVSSRQPAPSPGLHYKKDGALDMRYSSSKAAVASSVAAPAQSKHASNSTRPHSVDLHYKKDGTLDMRYTSSKLQQDMDKLNVSSQHSRQGSMRLTKQGLPDRRTKEGKLWALYQKRNVQAPSNVPLTTKGLPNMRTLQGKAWVQEQAACASATGELPDWLPRKKDNSLDYSSAVVRAFTATFDPSSVRSPPRYMAPELLEGNVLVSPSSDVYSFGVLLNELIQEEEPYYESLNKFHGKGPYAAVQHASNGGRPVIHASKTSAELTALIQQCWHKDATKRPSFDELARRLRTMEFANSC
uniref:Protein kinase domain-containing protein n=1 Tax=Globisporangium ultimum (strain ATCC 200006 / CBS 805.95 / DAOM BR144) TaxID=431595 RepID=K3X8C9_GLOUD